MFSRGRFLTWISSCCIHETVSSGIKAAISALNVARLQALRPLCHVKIDLQPFREGFSAIHIYGTEMCEEVFTAIVGRDEPEALGVAKPLNHSGSG